MVTIFFDKRRHKPLIIYRVHRVKHRIKQFFTIAQSKSVVKPPINIALTKPEAVGDRLGSHLETALAVVDFGTESVVKIENYTPDFFS